jgi:UDPglucose 6-dehydrogenase
MSGQLSPRFFTEVGYEVVNVDVDQEIVDTINNGTAPIHEDGLTESVAEHAGPNGTGRLKGLW